MTEARTEPKRVVYSETMAAVEFYNVAAAEERRVFVCARCGTHVPSGISHSCAGWIPPTKGGSL